MKKTNSNKKRITTIISLTLGLVAVFLVQQCVFAPPSFDKVMMQAASKVNESCPIMVDQETRLDNAVALPDNVFQYNYTLVNLVKDSIDVKAFTEVLKPMVLNSIRTNPDLKIFRDNKTTMAYNYRDMEGVFVSKISIPAEEYLMD